MDVLSAVSGQDDDAVLCLRWVYEKTPCSFCRFTSVEKLINAGRLSAGTVTAKKMFGEFGVYCDGKLVALVCDDRLFVKPTAAGRKMLPDAAEASPYPGAKPSIVVNEDRRDDGEWLGQLIGVIAAELPAPKLKARKAR